MPVINNDDNDNTQSFVPLVKGTKVGHYKIISKIGAGGMGEVYLAEDTELKREVAIKFLPAHLCGDEDYRARFVREARAVAALSHPNIVTIFEVGELKERPFFAMECVKGETLKDVIKKDKLTTNEPINYAMQICEGLHKAHESGIVHRDIKPGNIIIDSDNRARILDFGLAMVAGEEKLTKTGSTLGTVGYMSPEQIDGKKVDQRSDIFSVGVILYEMITGRRPFEGDNDAAVIKAITDSTAEPIARFKSGVTGQLQSVIDKVLSKDVSIRYQHADGMIADLKRLQTESTPHKKNKIGWWVAATAIVIVLIGYFLVDNFQLNKKVSKEGWTNSVAVLIFRNLSNDPEQDYFCEGMTEEIIGRLSTIKDLKVTSTQSMLRFKGTDLDLRQIGKELGVENILEGNIQISGDNIRVRAQLIRVKDDAHIWTEKYDRELKSTFTIQDEISRSIAEVLKTTLGGSEESFASRHGTDNIEAYKAYVKGRHFWRKRTREGLTAAIEHFENAVKLDSNYAAGWSGMSDGWSMLARYWFMDHLTGYSKADTFSLKALALDPNLAEAQASRGWVLYLQSKYDEAEKHLLRAIDLNPSYPWAHAWYRNVLTALGRNEEAIAQEEIAYELDPLSPAILQVMAKLKREAGNYEDAAKYCNTVLELEPLHGGAYMRLTGIYYDSGDTAKALETADQMIQQLPDDPFSYTNKGWVHWQLGRMDDAQNMYEKAVEIAPDSWGAHHQLAWFLQEGRINLTDALAHIERAVELDSLQARVRIFYGHVLRMMGRMDESLAQFKKVIELTPYDAEAYSSYGWAIGNGFQQYDEGIKYIKNALELNPNHVASLRRISLFYTFIWKTDNALEAINKSIELDASWPKAYQRKATIFRRAGMIDSALVWYQKHHELRSHDNHTFGMLGYMNMFLRNYDIADSIFNEFVERSNNPIERGWARSNQCDLLLHQGRFKEALTCYQKDIEIELAEIGHSAPLRNKYDECFRIYMYYLNMPEKAYEYLGMYEQDYMSDSLVNNIPNKWIPSVKAIPYAATGKVNEAKIIVQDLIINTDNEDKRILGTHYISLGEIYRIEKVYDSAAVLYNMSLELDRSFNRLNTLGVIYIELEKFDTALIILEEAMSKYDFGRYNEPAASVECHYYLGQAYEGVGRVDDAIKQYETFLDIWKDADEGLESVEDAKKRLAKLISKL